MESFKAICFLFFILLKAKSLLLLQKVFKKVNFVDYHFIIF
jgi:hypothetical protein